MQSYLDKIAALDKENTRLRRRLRATDEMLIREIHLRCLREDIQLRQEISEAQRMINRRVSEMDDEIDWLAVLDEARGPS
jgi:hypothetical protein